MRRRVTKIIGLFTATAMFVMPVMNVVTANGDVLLEEAACEITVEDPEAVQDLEAVETLGATDDAEVTEADEVTYDTTDCYTSDSDAPAAKKVMLVDSLDGLTTSQLKNPENGKWENIYFGNYQDIRPFLEPIKWRLLRNNSSYSITYGGKNKTLVYTLFLLADKNLVRQRYNKTDAKAIWGGCSLTWWLNGSLDEFKNDNFIDGAFSTKEQDAIMLSYVPDDGDIATAPFPTGDITQMFGNADRIFILSEQEATNSSYGFTDDKSRKSTNNVLAANGDYVDTMWWLRSPDKFGKDAGKAAYVDKNGTIRNNPGAGVSDDKAIRPALNIDLRKVLFISAADSGKSGDNAGVLSVPDTCDGSEGWKLTVKDANLSASQNGAVTQSGYTVKVPYKTTGDGINRLSVMITDKPYDQTGVQLLYYGALKTSGEVGATGTGEFVIPSDFDHTWKVYLVAENYNGEKKTDFASTPALIDMSGYTAPNAHTVVASDDGNGSATASVPSGYEGTNVEVKATPKDNYRFDHWEVVSGGVDLADAKNSTTTFTIKKENVEVKAIFVKIPKPGQVESPVFSPSGGSFTSAQNVTVSCATQGAKIYYTTDGSNPTTGSTLYSAPISVSTSLNIKAIAVKDGMTNSEISSATYIINGATPEAIYQVKATTDGNGTATATPASGKAGTEVKLAATPNNGYEFKEWTVVSGGVSLANKTSASTTFKIGSANVEVKAIFANKNTPISEKTSIKNATVKLSKTSLKYTGKAQKPTVKSVTLNGKTLDAQNDYTVSWSNSKSKKLGTYSVTITGKGKYKDSKTVNYKIVQGKNPLTVKLKKNKLNVPLSKLTKGNQTIKRSKYLKVSKNQGKVTYKRAKGNKKIVIDKKTGNITVKKGLKAGTYKVTISVKAAGNKNYKAATKKVTVKIVVK